MTERLRAGRHFLLCILLTLTLAPAAQGQLIDARLIPAGTLRIGFLPQYQSWDQLFAEDGASIPLGKYLSGDTAGSNLFPTLGPSESAIQTFLGNPDYRLSIGTMVTRVDADVRRFPFELSFGLLRHLTLTATVPIVVTRVNAAIALDSSTGNAGWNQAAGFESGNPAGPSQISTLLATLESRATVLESRIAAGFYGCPGSSMCTQARTLVVRTRAMRANLLAMAGTTRPNLPPAAPTAGSSAGTAIQDALASISAELQAFGLGPVGTMPLPARRFIGDDIHTILSTDTFGFQAEIPAYTKRPHLGDVEFGARFGLVQDRNLRLTLTGGARIPTGTQDSPDNLVDIGTGDLQPDATAGLELAIDGGPLSLAAAGSYSWQLPGDIVRRVTPPDRPIALAGTTETLRRDLGDALWLAGYPAIRLADGFHIFGVISYFWKPADHYEALTPGGPSPAVLDELTSMRSLSVGGGIAYRSFGRTGGFPVEAGVTYQQAISGSGGFAPKATIVTLYLRWYHRLWGSDTGREPVDVPAPSTR